MRLFFVLFFTIQISFNLIGAVYVDTKGHALEKSKAPVRITAVHLSSQNGNDWWDQKLMISFSFSNTTPNLVHGVMVKCQIRDVFAELLMEDTFKAQVVIPAYNAIKMGSQWTWNGLSNAYQKVWKVAANKTARIKVEVVQIVYADNTIWYQEDLAIQKMSEVKDEAGFIKFLPFVKNLNKKNDEGKNALSIAVEKKYWNVVLRLFKMKVDVNVKAKFGFQRKTCLHLLCEKGDYAKVKLFLKYGANPNIIGEGLFQDKTALHTAVKNKRKDIVKLLLQYGASVYKKDQRGRTPIRIAIKSRDWSMVRLLRRWRILRKRKK